MAEHYIACAAENETLLAAVLEKLARTGADRFVARVYSDDDVIRAVAGHDFGFTFPKTDLSLYRIADELARKADDPTLEPFRASFTAGWTPLVFVVNPEVVDGDPLGWTDLVKRSLRVRHASPRQPDGQAVVLGQHLALDSEAAEQQVQQQVEEYGPSDRDVLQRAFMEDGWRTDVVIAQERSVIELARQHPKAAAAIVYPRDGTLALPVSIAMLAGWYGEDPKAFASLAEGFRTVPDFALQTAGLHRAPNELIPPAGAAASNSALRWAPHSGTKMLTLPSRRAVRSIRDLAVLTQRPVDVCLLFDASESMAQGDKFGAAIEGLNSFVALLSSPKSRICLIRFQNHAETLVPLTSGANFRYDANSLKPAGRTALIDAVYQAIAILTSDGDRASIRAIAGFTDGQENASTRLPDDVENALRGNPGIRFYGVAYGSDADASMLNRLAAASDGLVVQGGASKIRALYERLSTYF